MGQAVQERARCDYRRLTRQSPSIPQENPAHPSQAVAFGLEDDLGNFGLHNPQVWLFLEHFSHADSILAFVHLGARTPDGRTTARVKQPKLDAHSVCHFTHRTAQRINFPDQVPLGDASNRRIARHLGNQVEVHSHHCRFETHPGARSRGFAAGMSGPDDDYFVGSVTHWKTPLIPGMLVFYPAGEISLKVLVIGNGGREHALAWRLAQCKTVSRIFATPGNPGCAQVAECVKPAAMTPAGYLETAQALGVGLSVVGPEAPLVDGIVDTFEDAGMAICGPSKLAAQLEGSKIFSKNFMCRHGIPTAGYCVAETESDARGSLIDFSYPIVIKADGLAAGKGVVIAEDRAIAESVLSRMFSGELVGKAGTRVILEEFLVGEEVSFIALTDGETILPFEPSQDHKAIFDGDKGPNTGGMGAYSDSLILTAAQRDFVMDRIIRPTVEGMEAEGMPFRGFLYAGLMMTKDGPKVLEYNVRLGDPETQPLMHRLQGDFAEVLLRAARRELKGAKLQSSAQPSLCVVMAAHGYPGMVRTGDRITGIEEAVKAGADVFQAGTRMGEAGLETSGGRVLGVTASGATLQSAIDAAYRAASCIRFDGMQMRRDIGRKGLSRYN
jgi:phosphoribosylamine--glycine ligase